jgi:C4-dicarboxylate-specific signal transduction histidine kinase
MNPDKDAGKDQLLRENGMAFFGAIVASVSHELNNVISIAYQNAGLLDDLLVGAKRGKPIPNERLEQIATTIETQTERGTGIIKHLNRFAHTVDEACVEFDVNDVVRNLTALMRRFALLRNADLKTDIPDERISYVGSPFDLQQVIFLAVRQLLVAVQEDDTILISIHKVGSGIMLRLVGRASEEEQKFDLEYIEMLVNHMGWTITVHTESERTTVELVYLPES